ncbi:PID-CTERM protein-sorting domain-containing protein [Parasediminibacterium paludis]|uniref:PID-CTERM protein-sorting domain-containing protein n=1 Tax=Parasediminibacterium paludis TaxID=908966 RepID=A0ABV8PQJ0_9BACT
MKTYTIILIINVAVIMLMPIFLLAQQPQANPFGNGSSDPDVPIDGGLSLLITTALGYGVKKLKEAKVNGNYPKRFK